MSKRIEKYTGMVIQPHVKVAEDKNGIEENLDRVCNMIDFGVGYFWEIPVRLIVLPEYFMQGVTTPGKGEHGIESFMKKAVTIPGPEMDRLGEKAKEYGLYIAGGGCDRTGGGFSRPMVQHGFRHWPGWQGDPEVPQVARAGVDRSRHEPARYPRRVQRKNRWRHQEPVPGRRYRDRQAWHDDLPRRLHSGSVSRALGLQRCGSHLPPNRALQEIEGVSESLGFLDASRAERARTTTCATCLGSNWGTVEYDYYPASFCPGHSIIVDYTGMIMREAPYPSEQVIGATIDIESLREHRARINHNCWVDVRTEGFRQIYENPIYPANRFPSGTPPRTLSDKMAVCRDAIDDLYARGQFMPPHGLHAEEMSGKLDERIEYAWKTGRLLKPE